MLYSFLFLLFLSTSGIFCLFSSATLFRLLIIIFLIPLNTLLLYNRPALALNHLHNVLTNYPVLALSCLHNVKYIKPPINLRHRRLQFHILVVDIQNEVVCDRFYFTKRCEMGGGLSMSSLFIVC